MKKLSTLFVLTAIVVCFAFTNTAHAAWYKCIVVSISQYDTGIVIVKVAPGTGETSFTGIAQIDFDATTSAGKGILATLLTAISLQSEITARVDYAPSSTRQTITGLTVVAP